MFVSWYTDTTQHTKHGYYFNTKYKQFINTSLFKGKQNSIRIFYFIFDVMNHFPKLKQIFSKHFIICLLMKWAINSQYWTSAFPRDEHNEQTIYNRVLIMFYINLIVLAVIMLLNQIFQSMTHVTSPLSNNMLILNQSGITDIINIRHLSLSQIIGMYTL